MQLPALKDIKKVHIIAVCGTLMGAFASYLKRQGIEVTGSDQNVYPPMSDVLSAAGVELMNGYRPENITGMKKRPDLVVIGNVISANNPEARAAIDGGYAYTSLPEAMEKLLLPATRNLVVAGTHGKTTTSSMLAHVLAQAKTDPSYFIGGVSQDLPNSFHVGKAGEGGYFVLEGDEYDTAFWDKVPKFNHYLPDDVILTSIEYDHADIYPDMASVIRAFDGLVARVRKGGRFIACSDYDDVMKVLKNSSVPVITYSAQVGKSADYHVGSSRVENGISYFDVLQRGKKIEEIALQLSGRHNMANALAVWLECRELKIPSEQILRGLKSFQGVKRRQEVRGEVRGVTVIDDFAHHPTAVRETLRALRLRYPGKRMVAIFEPRSATSRRKVFQQDYVDAFKESDATFIAAPYDQTKIASDDQFSSEQLVADLARGGRTARLMASVEQGVSDVAGFSRDGDLVAVLSNGGFGGFIPKLLDALKR
jgi:UDP-N-acetylmuramate: L-alanyl-gamma-D-glutamyl-meso-diaminopimelate ligase